MMVVPAPRAICPLSSSESRPMTVRVVINMTNAKLTTANSPTVRVRENISCFGIGVLLTSDCQCLHSRECGLHARFTVNLVQASIMDQGRWHDEWEEVWKRSKMVTPTILGI